MDIKILQVSESLQNGQVVSFPTETVYALAADPWDEAAVEAVYRLKQRRAENPLALLVLDKEQIDTLAVLSVEAKQLYDAFFPGPLTLILPRRDVLGLAHVNPGCQTIAVRSPDHPTAREILAAWGKPLVGTSANISGQPAELTSQGVKNTFGDAVPVVVDGTCAVGVASTIVDMTVSPPAIRRVGAVMSEDITNVLGIEI